MDEMDWPAGIYGHACSAFREVAMRNQESNFRGGSAVIVDLGVEFEVLDRLPKMVRRVLNFQLEHISAANAVKVVIEAGCPLSVWAPWLGREVPVLGRGLSPTPAEYAGNKHGWDKKGIRPGDARQWAGRLKRHAALFQDVTPWRRDDWPVRFGIKRARRSRMEQAA